MGLTVDEDSDGADPPAPVSTAGCDGGAAPAPWRLSVERPDTWERGRLRVRNGKAEESTLGQVDVVGLKLS